ncbi:hypothetical protein LSH36_32g21006 [Paralvinella palmiformis]|uniref:Large ribosomal subunit protein bL20m n=1 Tax=Paralvinella palmiformis TaxID=53620 RepID=A0AAD9K9S8_9ANNE|nr:hypothetical protein LSH36_32g21006 [Paralvinella palmiformis]
MVFLTLFNLARNRGPDKYWRVQQQLRMSWHFRTRTRTCYRIGMNVVNKALMYSYNGRKLKKEQMKYLWNTRIEAGAGEHGLTRRELLEGLARSDILLDKKVLSELAVYEPRTFQSLTEIAKKTMSDTRVGKPLNVLYEK